jgi:hypothetical protein
VIINLESILKKTVLIYYEDKIWWVKLHTDSVPIDVSKFPDDTGIEIDSDRLLRIIDEYYEVL